LSIWKASLSSNIRVEWEIIGESQGADHVEKVHHQEVHFLSFA
jgi:hypothetical protein